MKPSEKLFFEILQAGLWNKPIETTATRETLLQVIRLSMLQAVLGIVGDVIISHESLSALLSEEELKVLRKFVMTNLSTSRTWNIAVQKIVKEMRANDIEPILLKGQGIAQYYPNPDLRQCGDIDLYIRPVDFDRACEVISAMASPEERRAAFSLKKHHQIKLGKVPVEIHRYTDIYYPARLNRIYQSISDDGVSTDTMTLHLFDIDVTTPSLNFNAFYLFSHFWHHFIAEGVGLRQIIDWALLFNRFSDQIDAEYLRNVLLKMHLMKQWVVFGHIVVDFLGLPKEKFPLYSEKYKNLSEKALSIILIEGNFGNANNKGTNRPQGYLNGKLYAMFRHLKRNLRVISLFPRDALFYIIRKICNGIKAVFLDIFRKKR